MCREISLHVKHKVLGEILTNIKIFFLSLTELTVKEARTTRGQKEGGK